MLLRHFHSIRLKLIVLILGTAGVTIVGSMLSVFFWVKVQTREDLKEELRRTAASIEGPLGAAISFDDRKEAARILQGLEPQSSLVGARVFGTNRTELASWRRAGYSDRLPEKPQPSNQAVLQKDRMLFSREFADPAERGKLLGSLYLESNLERLHEVQGIYFRVMSIVVTGAFLLAGFLAVPLQRVISRPISSLAETAKSISRNKDYSVRARKMSDDEIGVFTEIFNQMLAQIQEQDAALRKAKDELEVRVQQRTRELSDSHKNLETALSILKATLESTVDGILVVNTEGKVVTHNQKFIDMWRIPPGLAREANDQHMIDYVLDQVKNVEGFVKKIRDLYEEPEAESHDVIEFKDGRIFERYSKPHRVEGRSVGRVWSFRDVTERERVAGELRERTDKLQRFQNLTVSRELEMVKLKEEVNGLLAKLHQSPKYRAPEQIRSLAQPKTMHENTTPT